MLHTYVFHWMRHIGFRVKILTASDTESDCAICCTLVTPSAQVRTVQCMYTMYPERDQYIKAC